MDISQKTLVELKALAFDEISVIEQAQHNLKVINEEMNKRKQAPTAEVLDPEETIGG